MRELLERTIDARPLALCRILVGLASIPLAIEWFIPLWAVASGRYLVLPVFEWLPTVHSWFPWVLVCVALVGAIWMIFGVAGRLPAWIVAGTASLALLADQQAYSNHLMLLVMLATFVGLSGSSEAFRGTRWRGTRQVPYWPAFLIQFQIATLYAWTAISKINDQYLSGEVLEVSLRSWVPIPVDLLPVAAWASIVVELFLSIALWVPRLRLAAFVAGFGLHAGILVLLADPYPLIPFAALMLTGYVLFAHDSLQRYRRISLQEGTQKGSGAQQELTN